MSRKKTASAESNIPKPLQNSSIYTRSNGKTSRLTVGAILKNTITMTTAIREIAKLTNWNSTFSIGKIIFEILIFLIRGADSRIEVMAVLVESDIRANNTLPRIRYMGKLATSPNFSTLVKTAARTHIISNGLSTDQATPKTLRRYLSLKSLETREDIVNQFRCNSVCAVTL